MTRTVLITGAAGAVGSAVAERLEADARWNVVRTDIDTLDVTHHSAVSIALLEHDPDVVLHLAGQKHAPVGEIEVEETLDVNVEGTRNVIEATAADGVRVVTASTCKACDPETVYGATKLIAERLTLNAGGVVIRFHNIPEAGGNVLRLWESLPADEPLPVCDAYRYFLPMSRAVDLAVRALELPGSARYMADPGDPVWIPTLAEKLYPGRDHLRIPLRRGDRHREPLHAACETLHQHGDLFRIVSPYDPPAIAEQLAA